jgi:hypothetical protein
MLGATVEIVARIAPHDERVLAVVGVVAAALATRGKTKALDSLIATLFETRTSSV